MVRAVSHVVALHGFAATGRMWEIVDPAYVAPDLPADILAVAPERFVLAGYSMGGRVALQVALAAPERVKRLVLISATAGIEDPSERARRRAADERLAAELETMTIEAFADRWIAQPLFAGDPPEAKRLQRAEVLRCEPKRLATTLRELGQGACEPLWHRLAELTMPATVLAGERDTKYRALAGRITSGLRGQVQEVVVPGAGHGLPREAPAVVAAAIRTRRGA